MKMNYEPQQNPFLTPIRIFVKGTRKYALVAQ